MQEVRCAFVVLLMAGYWITECFPMAVTSLIPVVMFPALGILSTADTCTCYMNDTIMVFIGGLILAIAIEHCNLHLRIALGVMKTVGCSHARLLGGLCVVTTFISMWVSNTAATAMMVPIIFAVLRELEQVLNDFFCLISDSSMYEILYKYTYVRNHICTRECMHLYNIIYITLLKITLMTNELTNELNEELNPKCLIN